MQWRFIYVIEGIVSLCMAILAFFWIQDRPAKQGGWLEPDERQYLVLRNRFMYGAARAGTGSKDEFNWRDIVSALKVRPITPLCSVTFASTQPVVTASHKSKRPRTHVDHT